MLPVELVRLPRAKTPAVLVPPLLTPLITMPLVALRFCPASKTMAELLVAKDKLAVPMKPLTGVAPTVAAP